MFDLLDVVDCTNPIGVKLILSGPDPTTVKFPVTPKPIDAKIKVYGTPAVKLYLNLNWYSTESSLHKSRLEDASDELKIPSYKQP